MDWLTFQGNKENNGVFEANYNLMLDSVSEKVVQISPSDGIYGSMGGEILTYKKDEKNYIFAQYSDTTGGIHKPLSTPVIINDPKYGDVIYVTSTKHEKIFGTFDYPMIINAGSSNTLKVDKVRVVGHYHALRIATGLTALAPNDFSAEVVLSSDYGTYVFNEDCQKGEFVISLDFEKSVRTKVGCSHKTRQPKDKWIVIPDHHEAIVDRELFQKANDSIRKGRIPEYDRAGVKRGIIFCGCCGNRMELRKTKNPYYLCKRKGILSGSGCNELSMKKQAIEHVVWSVWQEHYRMFQTMPDVGYWMGRINKLKKQEIALQQKLEHLPVEK